MILNLKELNKFVSHSHFKMESPQNALELIRPIVYMASIDLKRCRLFNTCSQKPPSLLDIFCRGIFEIFMYAKWICTSHENIYRKFKNIIFNLSRKRFLIRILCWWLIFARWWLWGLLLYALNTIEILRSLRLVIHTDKQKLIPAQCTTY